MKEKNYSELSKIGYPYIDEVIDKFFEDHENDLNTLEFAKIFLNWQNVLNDVISEMLYGGYIVYNEDEEV